MREQEDTFLSIMCLQQGNNIKFIPMNNAEELINAGKELGVNCQLLAPDEASGYIKFVIEKFKPEKISGHLSIYNESISIPLQNNEFVFSRFLNDEPVFVFFDQENQNKGYVVVVDDGKKLSEIMKSSYGMEYFISNKKADYLIAVNWYVIEIAGKAIEWMSHLKVDKE
jgi:hypothetical protein